MDGKLGDWDLSGQIEMFVFQSLQDKQNAKFAIMYDANALYLSGEVRDPTPMMNRHNPDVTGDKGWDADSAQFRITVDPSREYPEEESAFKYSRNKELVDSRDDIKHLTLWYYTDKDLPVLQLYKGMSYRPENPDWGRFSIAPEEKFQSAYIPTPDGKGYTFEYRVPWTTLGVEAPPRGGDAVAGCGGGMWTDIWK
ncbi:sugar-binding protein [Puniceicoccus vermicola]|uniref:Carbohydrate-binding domain-containing protein n=1 Tax=Puniceicoccus vermicola TaxID=388746 RepID=A0A7X1AYW7_9BACT|nr:hypothetical protein [Puniceicoccus vermicola]